MLKVVDSWITSACERLGAAFDADKVILFGSHARGDATRRSDVDFLVLCETELPPLARIQKGLIAVGNVPASAVDVIVLTQKEFLDRNGFPFLKKAVQEGKVGYERPQAR